MAAQGAEGAIHDRKVVDMTVFEVHIMHPGDEHNPGQYPCDGQYVAHDSWHGTCYTHREGCKPWSWSCWQESCVRAWADRHGGCHVEIVRGLW